jgi:hypothetical protein
VWVCVHFYTYDPNLNPTHVEPGLDAGFIFHPWVHLKSEKTETKRNPKIPKTQKTRKNSKPDPPRKKPEKTKKKLIYKTQRPPEPDLKPDGFGCQISPAGSVVKFNPTTFFAGRIFG